MLDLVLGFVLGVLAGGFGIVRAGGREDGRGFVLRRREGWEGVESGGGVVGVAVAGRYCGREEEAVGSG